MGKTSNHKSNSSATDAKRGAKKASNNLSTVKKTIDLVVKRESKNALDDKSATVDSHAPGASQYVVAQDENGQALSTYLNWSDLKKNHNKFYVQQVLQTKASTGDGFPAFVYTRYGRVGNSGVTSLKNMGYDAAIKTYKK